MFDEKRDLSPDARREIEDEVRDVVKRLDPVGGVHARLYDDRERAIEEGRRDIGSGAAALAQEHLVIANELMRLAGNAYHNSPNGLDRVAEEILSETLEKTHRANGHAITLLRRVHKFTERGGWRR